MAIYALWAWLLFWLLLLPDFTGDDVLQQFSDTVRKGKTSAELIALIERALQAEVTEGDNGIKYQ